MSWLRTAIDVAHLGVAIEHSQKLAALERQGAEQALVQVILKELRDQVFHFNQAAQSVTREKNPKHAAIMMTIIHKNLVDSQISPDMFPELNDKEYTANTIRFIRENVQKMHSSFSARERATINATADAAINLPDYKFYLKNYDIGEEYKKALEVTGSAETSTGCLSRIGIVLMICLGCALPAIPLATIGNADEVPNISIVLALIIFALWGWILLDIFKRSSRKNSAKNIIKPMVLV